MRVVLVPVLEDNYAYLLIDEASKQAAAVDPAEPQKILAAAESENVKLTHILTTHKHWDHAGGNVEMAKLVPGIVVVGGATEGVDACTKPMKGGESLHLGTVHIRCLDTPFHTLGHLSYFAEDAGQTAVFTGDSLFVGGCGRFFEGDPKQAHTSLIEVLGSLPPDTKVYCGHEYTVKNLTFAVTAEPGNPAVQAKLDWAKQQVSKGLPTVPSTIAEELAYNPFLRVDSPEIQRWCNCIAPIDVLAQVRRRKDCF
ncbi:hypothetical protein CYMTET_43923 [Cymbomonas tetramitiformis]|uniref:hydroxyacylglutathione hydrolase n=1 Tax=Cymbomonas tetramitiformis TaxID=36881 RepID=A0AAE0C2W5_9CHLO|nr:hypothetical protein CYMTET_43923 [Cymbomonas tetramitiformis]